jgi:hypothetical protein
MGRNNLRLQIGLYQGLHITVVYRSVEGKYGLSYNAEIIKELERFQDGSMAQDLNRLLAQHFADEFAPGNDQFRNFV